MPALSPEPHALAVSLTEGPLSVFRLVHTPTAPASLFGLLHPCLYIGIVWFGLVFESYLMFIFLFFVSGGRRWSSVRDTVLP